MRVLVCGGRDYLDYHKVNAVLWDMWPATDNNFTVIQGGAKGADFLAKAWAYCHSIQCEEYPADWKKHGKAAGPIRNQKMLDEGKPDMVVAFPGGTGTADMVKRSQSAGLRVDIIE